MNLKRLAILVLVFGLAGCGQRQTNEHNKVLATPPNVASLIELSSESFRKLSLAQINLCCAQGLPGTTNLNIQECLTALKQMVARVRTETERHEYRLRQNPVVSPSGTKPARGERFKTGHSEGWIS